MIRYLSIGKRRSLKKVRVFRSRVARRSPWEVTGTIAPTYSAKVDFRAMGHGDEIKFKFKVRF